MKDTTVHLMTGFLEYTACGLLATRSGGIYTVWVHRLVGNLRLTWSDAPGRYRKPSERKVTCKNCLRIMKSVMPE